MSRTDIDFKIGADLKQFRSGMQNIDHSLKRLSGGFGALGASIGAAFVVDAIRDFAMESINLASQAEGVKAAFDRLNDPLLLNKLQEATAGTVSDLKLMQTAVKAQNFRIPMDTLAKGLEFAQRRAQATGESVDYMVDSFVTGLGRKSVMILDNLGISASELKEKMEGGATMAEAVGKIMDEEFARAGDRVVTTSMKIDQQKASIANLKTEIGEGLMPVYEGFLDLTNKFLKATIAAPDPFAVDGKSEESLRNQLKNIEHRIKLNDEELKKYPKNSTYIKNVTRLEEYRAETSAALNALLEEKKKLEMVESGEQARLDAEAEKVRKAEALAAAIEAYNLKLEGLLPNLKKVNYEIDQMFKPGDVDFGQLAVQLDFDEVNMELEELEDVVEYTADTFDNSFNGMINNFDEWKESVEASTDTFDDSFVKNIETLRKFADEVFIIGNILKNSFEAAFVPADQLEEGESRIMRFREVLVEQLRQMAAQMLATAAAAAILATILTVAFGGSNIAGQALFGKAGMGFGDLFGGLFQGMGGGYGFNGAGLGGNGQGIQIFGTLSGQDILLSNERASRNRTRQRGF